MVRTLVAVLAVVLVGAGVRAGEVSFSPGARHEAAHEADRERDGPGAKRRLVELLEEIIDGQKKYRVELDKRRWEEG